MISYLSINQRYQPESLMNTHRPEIKTMANLEAAFAGESMAHIKYRYFAKLARAAGDEETARTFEETADQEVMHAFGHLDLLYPKATMTPAKALQIAGLVDSVARHEPSALTPFVDVRNPLCAQPVVEACLSLPTPILTLGGRDRGLARHAFRDRLPIEIIERRSKGDMTRLYGRLVHDSLDFLRPWLLEGRLAGLGLLDVDAADLALTREALLWRGGYSAVMVLAAFEGWVRHWEARLAAPAAR